MTKQQIKWAAQHDWFVSTVFSGDLAGALVEDRVVQADGTLTTEHCIFTDFRKLRDWAGY